MGYRLNTLKEDEKTIRGCVRERKARGEKKEDCV